MGDEIRAIKRESRETAQKVNNVLQELGQRPKSPEILVRPPPPVEKDEDVNEDEAKLPEQTSA